MTGSHSAGTADGAVPVASVIGARRPGTLLQQHLMHERQNHGLLRLLLGVVMLAAGSGAPLAAQSGSRVIIPPKAADSASRQPQVIRPSAPAASTTAAVPTRPGAAVPQGVVLDSIREAVFRNLLERDRTGFATMASAFCLAVSNEAFKTAGTYPERSDASEAMVRRVQTSRAPARRASACTFTGNNPPTRGATGRAMLYTVGAISVDEDRAEVSAAYNYDGYNAGGYTFGLERSDSGWVVKQWRMEWTAKPQ